MLIRTRTSRPAERKAVILLVVISLLTLFAIVALSFLLYANAEANASKLFREAEANDIGLAGSDAEKLFSFFLKQFVYDAPDDSTGVYSAMRGYSLGRSIYGLPFLNLPANVNQGSNTVNLVNASYSLSPRMSVSGPGIPAGTTVQAIASPTQFTMTNPAVVTGLFNLFFGVSATIPFNGTGKLHTGPVVYGTLNFPDDYQMVNYTYFPMDGFLRDPEKLGVRAGLGAPPGPYTGGFNAPYTYPDLNNMYLAAVKADGTLLSPSFHRHWLFNPTTLLNDAQNNPNWGDPQVVGPNPPPIGLTPAQAMGKYALLRPRPVDQLLSDPKNPGFLESFPPNRPYFDYPEDPGGDIKNLPGPGYTDPRTGQMFNNDSVWIDLGAPVMTHRNGTKYKALFAPLILDLDNRINLNVAGNVRLNAGTGNPRGHASNQGWGPWEMNLGLVLNNLGQGGQPEWTNLFFGDSSGTYAGRYGQQGYPGSPNIYSAPGGDAPHFYGQVDYDGCDEINQFRPSVAITLPTTTSTSFPTYNNPPNVGGYGNGNPTPTQPPPPLGPSPLTYYPDEHYLHPLLYNYFQPDLFGGSSNQVFGISNMEALLRSGDVNSSGLTSDLMRLCPTNFPQGASQAPNSTAQIRNLVTTHSFDVDRPGLSPWAIPPGGAGANYAMPFPAVPGSYPQPTGMAAGFPPLAARNAGGGSGEFAAADWRAISAALGRVNLNRKLTSYQTNAAQATLERQQFAADIFIRLVLVTGAYDIYNAQPAPPPPPPMSPGQFDALRWLAQLAVNIVDFVDPDDVMTPFNWANVSANPATYQNYIQPQFPYAQQFQTALTNIQTAATTYDSSAPWGVPGWVFGTELPRVVVNEAYAEYTGGDNTNPYSVNVWAELHNPFNVDLSNADPLNGNALLQAPPLSGGYSIYQLALSKTTSLSLRSRNNVTGEIALTDYYTQPGMAGPPCNTLFNQSEAIQPYNNGQPLTTPPPQGFLVVGPTAGPANPAPDTKYATMTYSYPASGMATPPAPPSPTILLRRLANPYTLPNFPGQNSPPYSLPLPYDSTKPPNPYITVDYMEGGTGFWTVANSKSPGGSYGRTQPYAGNSSQAKPQTNGGSTPPNTTFKAVNTPNTSPFNWLTHLDRQVVSPMELLQVSAFKPQELTQQFVTGGVPNGQRAFWLDEDISGPPPLPSHLLWRLFEFLETGNRAAGMTPGGRIPGKINLNNLWDVEPFLGMSDPQPSNSFSGNSGDDRDVNMIFQKLVALRSPKGYPDGNDVPLVGLAAAFTNPGDTQYAQGSGIGRTLLRPPAGAPTANQNAQLQVRKDLLAALTPSQDHPYFQDMLLSKIFNNITTRSNVFAVWVTVGFFQVYDRDPVTGQPLHPIRLGAEIGKAENRQVRHRMFAIIDRSALATERNNPNQVSPPPVYLNADNYMPNAPPPGPVTSATMNILGQFVSGGAMGVPAAQLQGTYETIPWGIQAYQPPPPTGGLPIMGTNLLIDTGAGQELVNVFSITQGPGTPAPPPVVTINGSPNLLSHSSPLAVTPVNTISAYSAIAPGPQATVSVSAVNGVFEGVQWSLQAPTSTQPGTTVLVDVGGAQELAVVQGIGQPAAPGQPWTLVLQAATPTGMFANPHMPGALGAYTISYPIPVLGNPGPQPNLKFRQVPWVVRYFSIIN